MSATPHRLPDPVELVESLDPDEIARHMDLLHRQLVALRTLYRAATARRQSAARRNKSTAAWQEAHRA